MTTPSPSGAQPRYVLVPKLSATEHAELDSQLHRLMEALSSRPLPDHAVLVQQAQEILEGYPTLFGHLAWTEERVYLSWGQFGDSRVPVWKAMHAACRELAHYVHIVQSSRQAGVVAEHIDEYLELRRRQLGAGQPNDPPKAKATEESPALDQPADAPCAESLSGRETDILRAMLRKGFDSLERKASQDAIADAVERGLGRQSLSRPFRRLRDRGLITSSGPGSGSGTYLTSQGSAIARRLSESAE